MSDVFLRELQTLVGAGSSSDLPLVPLASVASSSQASSVNGKRKRTASTSNQSRKLAIANPVPNEFVFLILFFSAENFRSVPFWGVKADVNRVFFVSELFLRLTKNYDMLLN